MSILGNILWVILGGFFLAAAWFIIGIILCITVIGIPAGVQCIKIAGLVLLPFGKRINYGGKTGSLILNILWMLIFGWELAIGSLFTGIIFCITIIGIPFGKQYFKLAKLALMPFGTTITKN